MHPWTLFHVQSVTHYVLISPGHNKELFVLASYLLQWPRFHVAISSRFVQVKDRFVIGLKIKEKHIRAGNMGI